MSNEQTTTVTDAPQALTADQMAAELAAWEVVADDDTIDLFTTLVEEARPTYTPEDWATVAEAFGICPTHNCDSDICREDAAWH